MWKLRTVLRALAALATVASAQAVTLDWNINNTFTQGQVNSYDVDPSSPGADISVGISTANLGTGTMSNAVDATLEGGLGPGHNTLGILMNFTNTGEFVTVTITFSGAYTQGVTNVKFSLFDVDYANSGGANPTVRFQDQLRSITATTINNTTVGATITGSLNNSVTGTSPNQIVDGIANTASTGTGSGDANVTIDFGTNAIKSFTFVYGSGAANGNIDPTQQKIGLYNIDFTPVPEINPSWSALVSCVLASGLILRHRAKARK